MTTQLSPERRAEIRARYDAAMDMVSALCTPRGVEGHRDWLMSIPARPDHDPDLVIGDALMEIPKLLAALDAAEAEVERLRAENTRLGHRVRRHRRHRHRPVGARHLARRTRRLASGAGAAEQRARGGPCGVPGVRGERGASVTLPEPYYDSDGITIYCGDACEILQLLEPGSVDLVLTDPPYPNNAGHFADGIMAAEWFLTTYIAPRFLVFWHQLIMPPVPLPLVARHIWFRNNSNRPDNYEAIYEFADEGERASRVFSYPVIYPGLTGCHEATGHPTQKSLKLMRRLVQLRPCQTVLDPFMGSGTTARACMDLGRRFIGIEISEAYCEIAVKRLRQQVLPLEARP